MNSRTTTTLLLLCAALTLNAPSAEAAGFMDRFKSILNLDDSPPPPAPVPTLPTVHWKGPNQQALGTGPFGTDKGGILDLVGIAHIQPPVINVLSDLQGDLLPLISTLRHAGIAKVATQTPAHSTANCAYWYQDLLDAATSHPIKMTFQEVRDFVRTDTALAAQDCIRWRGGRSVLVITGDMFDGGPHAKSMVHFLLALRRKAREAGGDVVLLLGNHDLAAFHHENAYGPHWLDLAQFAESEDQLAAWYELVLKDPAASYKALGKQLYANRVAWLRANYRVNPLLAAKIGNNLFTHAGLISRGGIGPNIVELNQFMRARFIEFTQSDSTSAFYGQLLGFGDSHLVNAMYHLPNLGEGKNACTLVAKALEANEASRIFVGHIETDNRVGVYCNQRIFDTDVRSTRWRGGRTGQAIVSIYPASSQHPEGVVKTELNPVSRQWITPRLANEDTFVRVLEKQ